MPPSTQVQKPVSEQQIASMFDRIAFRYDFLNKLLSFRQDLKWRRQLLAMVPFRPRGLFVDVATGTGDVIIGCQQEHPEYDEYIGIDISSAMLARATEKAAKCGAAAKISFTQGSAERLPIASGCADALSIAFGLRNVVNRPVALKDFARVLKSDGVLLILEFFSLRPSWWSRLFNLYFHKILPFIGGLLSDRKAYTYLPQSVGSFYTMTELRQTLYELGFVVEDEVNYLFGACCLVKARKVGLNEES